MNRTWHSCSIAFLVAACAASASAHAGDPELKLVFTGRQSGSTNDVWIANPDGSNPQNLTSDFATSVDTAFTSPSGEFIAFESDPSGGFQQLWIMKSDGTQKRQLTNLNHQYGPQIWGWLNNEEILFRWAPGASQGDVFKINIATGAMTLVLSSSHAGINQASIDALAISPDRTKIAFTAQAGSWGPTTDVYTYDLVSGTVCTLHMDSPDDYQDWTPRWFDNDTVFWSHNAAAGLTNNFEIMRKDLCATTAPQVVMQPVGATMRLCSVLAPFGKMLVVHGPQNHLGIVDINTGVESIFVAMATGSAEWAVVAPPPVGCDDIDFNNDGLFPDTTDIDAFLNVFSGGPCL